MAVSVGTSDLAPVMSGAREQVVVLGDSVAHGAGDEQGLGISGWLARYTGLPIMNLGVNGARTGNVRSLLRDRSAQSQVRAASVIVLSIGGNDLYGDSIAQILARVFPNIEQEITIAKVHSVVGSLRRLNPTARIDVLGLYNPYHHSTLAAWLDEQVNRWDARLIWSFADWQRVNVVRIADLLQRDDRISPLDRFHPASAGYSLIASRIAAAM
ncbi:MAG TPA: GDSL-type esterase/lipase family protein [Thermoanaerobaculia bacterium]|nr:GDSL-type esterase/lipase family protein [Thermoanaerobaculia bacterium]